jgi:predicted transporter
MRYNNSMSTSRKCNINQTAKWIRVIVSLGVIGAGIYYKNWIGLLGIVTLLSAFTSSCPLSLQFTGLRDIRIRRSDDEEE